MGKVDYYASVIGLRFRPTFESPIDYFEIRGYDAERDMVLTIVHPKEGESFDDEIEEVYLQGAFDTGEYKVVDEKPSADDMRMFQLFARPYLNMMPPTIVREQRFFGPCCERCQHRFGTTSNSGYCSSHYKSNNCYRFKLER